MERTTPGVRTRSQVQRDNVVEVERLTPGVRTRSQVKRDNGVEDASREAKKIRVDSDEGEDDEDVEEAYSCSDEDDSDEEDEEEEDSEDEIDGDGSSSEGGRKRRQGSIARRVQFETVMRKPATVRAMTAAEIRNAFAYEGVNEDLLKTSLGIGNKAQGDEIVAFVLRQPIVPKEYGKQVSKLVSMDGKWRCVNNQLLCPVKPIDMADVVSSVEEDLEDLEDENEKLSKSAKRRRSIKHTYMYEIVIDGKRYCYVGESSQLVKRLETHITRITQQSAKERDQNAHKRLMDVLRSENSLKYLGLDRDAAPCKLWSRIMELGVLRVYSFAALGVQDYREMCKKFVNEFKSKHGRGPKRSTVECVLGAVGMVQEAVFTSWLRSSARGGVEGGVQGLNESYPGVYWSIEALLAGGKYSFKDIADHPDEFKTMVAAYEAAKKVLRGKKVPWWYVGRDVGGRIPLGVWVSLVRHNFFSLDIDQQNILESVDFEMLEGDRNTLHMLEALQQYADENGGDANPPRECAGPKKGCRCHLGRWCASLRRRWEKLPNDIKKKLLAIGFRRHVSRGGRINRANYDDMLEALQQYADENGGDANPPYECAGPKKGCRCLLGRWCANLRQRWEELPNDIKKKLLAMGFRRHVSRGRRSDRDSDDDMLEVLQQYADENGGDANPPRECAGPKKGCRCHLGRWCASLRQRWEKLPNDIKKKLLAIGFRRHVSRGGRINRELTL